MKRFLAALAVVTLSAGTALADDDCRVPPQQMQSWEAVAQLAADYGWTISSIEIDDGCYELKVTDIGGNTLKAEIDPATLQVIEAKLRTLAPAAPGPPTPAANPTPAPSN